MLHGKCWTIGPLPFHRQDIWSFWSTQHYSFNHLDLSTIRNFLCFSIFYFHFPFNMRLHQKEQNQHDVTNKLTTWHRHHRPVILYDCHCNNDTKWKLLSIDLPPTFPSCTVLLPNSPFAMMDTDTHTHIHNIDKVKINYHTKNQGRRSNGLAVRVFTHTQTHTQTDRTNSITSTADAGGNKGTLRRIGTFILCR